MARSGPSVQIVEIKYLESLALKKGAGFMEKNFSRAERAYCGSKKNKFEHYSARYAAKAALLEASGLKSSPVPPAALEIVHRKTGQPFFKLPQKVLRELKIARYERVELSLAHERDFAVASVMIVRA